MKVVVWFKIRQGRCWLFFPPQHSLRVCPKLSGCSPARGLGHGVPISDNSLTPTPSAAATECRENRGEKRGERTLGGMDRVFHWIIPSAVITLIVLEPSGLCSCKTYFETQKEYASQHWTFFWLSLGTCLPTTSISYLHYFFLLFLFL